MCACVCMCMCVCRGRGSKGVTVKVAYTVHTHSGPIPMGYRFLAKSTSETTHEIPIEGFDTAERDYRQIVYELHQFLNPEGY